MGGVGELGLGGSEWAAAAVVIDLSLPSADERGRYFM
jgi:hypothetical protein